MYKELFLQYQKSPTFENFDILSISNMFEKVVKLTEEQISSLEDRTYNVDDFKKDFIYDSEKTDQENVKTFSKLSSFLKRYSLSTKFEPLGIIELNLSAFNFISKENEKFSKINNIDNLNKNLKEYFNSDSFKESQLLIQQQRQSKF